MGKAVGLTDSHGLAPALFMTRFYCNSGLAAATSLSAGVLAAQSASPYCFKYASVSRACACPSAQRDSTISRRTVMNNAG